MKILQLKVRHDSGALGSLVTLVLKTGSREV
jgi:hypothetical protein